MNRRFKFQTMKIRLTKDRLSAKTSLIVQATWFQQSMSSEAIPADYGFQSQALTLEKMIKIQQRKAQKANQPNQGILRQKDRIRATKQIL